jgi:hypothetical protein
MEPEHVCQPPAASPTFLEMWRITVPVALAFLAVTLELVTRLL